MPEFLPQRPDSLAWVVLAALAVISVAAATVSLYKVGQFLALGVGRRRAAEAILADWLAGDGAGAWAAAQRRHTVGVRVLFAALSGLRAQPGDRDHARELATQAALAELAALSRRMPALEAVVQVAPMLGLLGTVIGMIEAFGELARSAGAVEPAALAGGIWTALITTAVGLAIAIVFYFVAIWLEGRISAERTRLEELISAVLHGRPGASGPAAGA